MVRVLPDAVVAAATAEARPGKSPRKECMPCMRGSTASRWVEPNTCTGITPPNAASITEGYEALNCNRVRSRFAGGGTQVGSSRPVSYTHLDVYKRQGLRFGCAVTAVDALPEGAGTIVDRRDWS